MVSSAIEHPAITKCLDHLESEGKLDVSYVGVDEEGRVSSDMVAAALRPETALVTIMHSNNEARNDKKNDVCLGSRVPSTAWDTLLVYVVFTCVSSGGYRVWQAESRFYIAPVCLSLFSSSRVIVKSPFV